MITQVRLGCGPGIRHSRDASPCCCASLKWRHRPFAQIGAQRVGNRLSILPLILVEETTCNEPPHLVLVQRKRDALLTGLAPPTVTAHALGAGGDGVPRDVVFHCTAPGVSAAARPAADRTFSRPAKLGRLSSTYTSALAFSSLVGVQDRSDTTQGSPG